MRYDGAAKPLHHPFLQQWLAEGRIIPLCPEALGGLPTPRPPAEIRPDGTVVDSTGQDVGAAFHKGAEAALELAQHHNCVAALLMDGSPSCGASFVYDGSFCGKRIPGQGITTACLRAAGIAVFAPSEIDDLARFLRDL